MTNVEDFMRLKETLIDDLMKTKVPAAKTFEQEVREVVVICDALAEAKETEAEWCFDFARAIAAKVEAETKKRCALKQKRLAILRHGYDKYLDEEAILSLPSKYKEPT